MQAVRGELVFFLKQVLVAQLLIFYPTWSLRANFIKVPITFKLIKSAIQNSIGEIFCDLILPLITRLISLALKRNHQIPFDCSKNLKCCTCSAQA